MALMVEAIMTGPSPSLATDRRRRWLLVICEAAAAVYQVNRDEKSGRIRAEAVEGGRFSGEEDEIGDQAAELGFVNPRSAITLREKDLAGKGLVLSALGWLVSPTNLDRFDNLTIMAARRISAEVEAALPMKLSAKLQAMLVADAQVDDLPHLLGQATRLLA